VKIQPRPNLIGKVVIVTGASSGIGQAAARAFGEAGATVVLAARREDRLRHLAEEINAAGGQALAVPTDLCELDQITHLVQKTVEKYGRIDVLANIAGQGRYDWIEELTTEEVRSQFEVGLLALAELTRQVIPIMKRQRSGHIMNMSSYASRIASPPLTVYASTKYAVEGLSDGLRRELAPWGIMVTRIHPGGVPGTEFNRKAAQGGGVKFRSFPFGRVSKERVALELVKLVEKPRRELLLGRMYDLLVFLNRQLPGVVDKFSSLWVRRKRAKELEASEIRGSVPTKQTARFRLPRLAAMATGLILGGIVVGTLFLKREHSANKISIL